MALLRSILTAVTAAAAAALAAAQPMAAAQPTAAQPAAPQPAAPQPAAQSAPQSAPQSAVPPTPVEVRTARGLRIWQVRGGQSTFGIAVLVGAGFRHELVGEAGLAHMLEHCLFESTARRSRAEWRERLRALRVHENGVTTPDYTAYHAVVPMAGWRDVVAWLGEALTQPGFTAADIERQRRIVLEELDLRRGAVAMEALLYAGGGFRRDVRDEVRAVQGAQAADLERFYRRHYRTGNVAVAFALPAGGPPAAEVVAAIEQAFAGLAEGGRSQAPPAEPILGEQRLDRGYDPADRRGYLRAGYHVAERTPQALAALLVAQRLLDAGFHSEIREQRALAYAPKVSAHLFDGAWRLDFEVQVSEHENLATVRDVIAELVAGLAQVEPAGFERARADVLARLEPRNGMELVELAQQLWLVAPRGASAPLAVDLAAVLRDLPPHQVAQLAARNLVDAHRFALIRAPSAGLFALPWSLVPVLLLLVALVDGLFGFSLWRGLRRRLARRRRRPPRGSAPLRHRMPPPVPRVQPEAVNELEREIQAYLEREAKGE